MNVAETLTHDSLNEVLKSPDGKKYAERLFRRIGFNVTGIFLGISVVCAGTAWAQDLQAQIAHNHTMQVEANQILARELAYQRCIEQRRANYLSGELSWFKALDYAEHVRAKVGEAAYLAMRLKAYEERIPALKKNETIVCEFR
jgi:hypothetical protein